MWLRVLGSSAGGGYPQWNCRCPVCQAVRDGSRPSRARTQSSIAVSADYERWFVFNASPDIRTQIESFPALHPHGNRNSPVQAVLLTDAELDHTLGMLLLREAGSLDLHATPATYETLQEGTSILRTLEAYGAVKWHPVEPGVDVALDDGLSYRAFDVPTIKPARFGSGEQPGRVVGYRLTDERTGSSAAYVPGIQQFTTELAEQLTGCSCVLIDGTCWRNDELIELGVGSKTAWDMGHLPIDGPDGSLARLSSLPIERRIYIHINNTNPILLEDSTQRRLVEERGLEVATDGLEVRV